MKSLSPFVSTILMISLIIGTGTIVYSFFTGTLKLPSQQTKSLTEKVISCTGGDFKLYWNKVCQLKNGLVAWYRLDSVNSSNYTLDYSGYNNDGKLYNYPCNPAYCNITQGQIGNALSFDGVDDYVNVGVQASLVMKNAFSVVAWVYPKGQTPNSIDIIVNKEGEYEIARYGDGTIIYAIANTNPGWTWVNTGYVATLNTWTHIVWIYSALDGVIKLYANGILVYSRSGSGNVGDYHSDLNDFRIGSRQWPGDYFFNGTIDEVRIYNRALSEEEIKQLYYNGLNNKFNISFTMLYTGVQAQNIGKDFTATIFLSNGTTITKAFSLDNPLGITNTLAKVNLTIDGYYPSYGLIDKITVCSNSCPYVCSELSSTASTEC